MNLIIFATLLGLLFFTANCGELSEKTVKMVTYNVNEKEPKGFDFTELFGLKNRLPDFFAVGLEEAPLTMTQNPWITEIKKVLRGVGYQNINRAELLGIQLIVFAKKELMPQITGAETRVVKTGFGGYLGNKGGISVRFNFGDTSVAFVAAHLAAHDEHNDQRIQDYNTIVKETQFAAGGLLDQDYVLWMGDLNFRVNRFSIEEVIKGIADGAVGTFLDHDQLTEARTQGKAFAGFQEMRPPFLPTFKFHVGSDNYNPLRKPAWTDRILYRVGTKAGLGAQQLAYVSIPKYQISDHKPVSSVLSLKMG